MTKSIFNIVIPSINIDKNLLFCLKKLNKLNYKNFFVTVILDDDNFKLNKKNYNYKINIIYSTNKNMSAKRNLAAKKFKSTYLAFLDSDAYPNINWLNNALSYFKKYDNIVLGGPNIPFPHQKQYISHLSKRSFFVNGHLAYRKYMSKKKFINDWLESCNFFISRDIYNEIKGMNENIYIGEDQDFFKRLKKIKKETKILFCPTLYVFHKERIYSKLVLQRFSFGMDIFSGISFANGIRGLMVALPLLILLSIIIFFLAFDFNIYTKLKFFSSFLLLINVFIAIDILKFSNSFTKNIFTLLSINFLNFIYSIAGLLTLLGFKKSIQKKIYKKSQ